MILGLNEKYMSPFKFKQFSVHHQKTAHKVGTDGVLLGAWTSLSHQPQGILDIGAGSGLIALMMAQRSSAENIDAIEINADAFEECVHNFEASPWNDRLFCYHGDVKTLAQEPDLKYDLMVSNPPFFERTQETNLNGRNQARNQVSLSESDLLESVQLLLNKNGQFATILPYQNHQTFIEKAKVKGLFLNRMTHVKGQKHAPPKRSLMQFGYKKQAFTADEMVLEISRHIYTDEYKALVKDFYLGSAEKVRNELNSRHS